MTDSNIDPTQQPDVIKPESPAASSIRMEHLPRKKMSPLALILILSSIFFAVFLAASGALFVIKSGGKSAGSAAPSLFGGGAVGVVDVTGVIMDSRRTIKRLETLDEDPEVKAIVIRLNSPGGAVAPSQEIYEAVRKCKKPVIASMASVAASGAFYIAAGASKVFANAGTITGSIGVIMEFANLEKLYEWAKIRRYVIKTGKFKDVGSEFREMTPEDRELLQSMIDDVLLQFKTAVSQGRKLSMEQVTKIADGRIMSGQQAKALKLVDELGTFNDAIDEAAKVGKIKGKPRIIHPESGRRRWLDLLLDDAAEESSGASSVGDLAARFLRGLRGDALALRSFEEGVSGRAPGIYWLWSGAR